MEPTPDGCIDRFLNPGEHYFGDHQTRIRTLLGSCVAVTMWHPRRRIGGMCHFLVPGRCGSRSGEPDGRYGSEALLLLVGDAVAADADPAEFQFKVFGGGNMFPDLSCPAVTDVGSKNVRFARTFLSARGYLVDSHHVQGNGHRHVVLDLWTGDVWVRHQEIVSEGAMANG